MIIRLIKLVIDTAIHGYALHTVYGCSLHLLGALWSSLANLLLHLARESTRRSGDDNQNNQSPVRGTTIQDPCPDPTAPTEIITQPPPPIRPPRTTIPCNEGNTKNVNMPTSYTNLQDRLTTLNENI